MSEWEMLDDGSWNGVAKFIGAGEEPDDVKVKHVFDPRVTKAIIEQNKAAQGEDWDRKADMVKVAHIPPEVQYEWWHRYRINSWGPNEDDQRRMKKLLNSNEWRYLKFKHIIL